MLAGPIFLLVVQVLAFVARRAVADRLGFREGVHREDVIVNGRFRDTVIYAILEDDWRSSERP